MNTKSSRKGLLQTTVLAASLLVAFGHAYADPTKPLTYTSGENELTASPYTDTIIDVSGSGTSLSGSNVSISGPGGDHSGEKFSRNGMVVVGSGALLNLTENSAV